MCIKAAEVSNKASCCLLLAAMVSAHGQDRWVCLCLRAAWLEQGRAGHMTGGKHHAGKAPLAFSTTSAIHIWHGSRVDQGIAWCAYAVFALTPVLWNL